jgi:hypothetical protein
MDNYTMTFKYDGDFDLPNDPEIRDAKVPGMVLEKMKGNEFELIDFNLSRHYDDDNAEEYIENPFLHRSVLEIKLDLTMEDLQSREAIYSRCLEAMQSNKLRLKRAYENDNKKMGMLQSIILFSM